MAKGFCMNHEMAYVDVPDSEWPANEHYGHNMFWKDAPKGNGHIAKVPEPILTHENVEKKEEIIRTDTNNLQSDTALMRSAMSGINNIILEREELTRMSTVGLIAGHNGIIYGPRGEAKSKFVRTFAQSFDFSYWDTTISEFTTEDNLFGAYDLIKMRDHGVYERRAASMLTHEIIFLDELGNSSGPLRNTIKTAINEHVYRNGDVEIALPLRMLIGASNSKLIDTDAVEEAFSDRFLWRYLANPMQEDENIIRMIEQMYNEPLVERIDGQAIVRTQRLMPQVTLTRNLIAAAQNLRKEIVANGIIANDVSNRRFFQSMQMAIAHALLAGRMRVNMSDLKVFAWTFWFDPETEQRPLEEYLKLHLQNQLSFLEGMRGEYEQAISAWQDQQTNNIMGLTAQEMFDQGMKVRGTLNTLMMGLTMTRPKLEDQEETDYANDLEKDIKGSSDKIAQEALAYKDQDDSGDSNLDELKKG